MGLERHQRLVARWTLVAAGAVAVAAVAVAVPGCGGGSHDSDKPTRVITSRQVRSLKTGFRRSAVVKAFGKPERTVREKNAFKNLTCDYYKMQVGKGLSKKSRLKLCYDSRARLESIATKLKPLS